MYLYHNRKITNKINTINLLLKILSVFNYIHKNFKKSEFRKIIIVYRIKVGNKNDCQLLRNKYRYNAEVNKLYFLVFSTW